MNKIQDDDFFETCGLRVLMAIRRIIRAVDIYSRRLNSEFRITAPQLICLYSVSKQDGMTLSVLAKKVNLGISTVNGIVDRLEEKGSLERRRSDTDRRRVKLSITQQGRDIARAAPALLQDRLAYSLRQLPDLEQAAIALSLERVVNLMEAESLDASPNLVLGTNIGDLDTEEGQLS